MKALEKKIELKQKNKSLIYPVVNKIIDITNCLFEYQKDKNIDLINDEIWKNLIEEFKKDSEIDIFEDKNVILTTTKKSKDDAHIDFELCDKKLNEKYEDFFLDYLNYTGLFNDIIIPHELRCKKYSYIDLYSDFYDYSINNIDI